MNKRKNPVKYLIYIYNNHLAYVTALLKNTKNTDFYIGLWSPGGFTGNAFFYEDNSEISFTKYKIKPNSVHLN